MAAVCVQAIWTASAPSISSFGAAASIIASAAFMESSEIPPQGERHADCIWNKRGVHEVARRCAESFIQPSPPIFALAVRRMYFCYLAIRPKHLDTDRRKAALDSHARAGELFGLFVIRLIPAVANAFTNDRSHLRSSIASAVQFPLRKFPFFVPRGAPGLNPPCKRHRLRPRMAGRWHAVPARVSAPQRGARLRFSSRVSTSWSMGLSANFCRPRCNNTRDVPHGVPPKSLPFRDHDRSIRQRPKRG